MIPNPPADGQWLCKPCYNIFGSLEALKAHKAREQAESSGQHHVHCEVCCQDFDSHVEVVEHVRDHHEQLQGLMCPGCGSGPFDRVSGLISHIENGECHCIDSDMIDKMRERKLEFPRELERVTKQPVKNNFSKYMPGHKFPVEHLWGEPTIPQQPLVNLADNVSKLSISGEIDAVGKGRAVHDGATSGVKLAKGWTDPHNPECPSFNVSRYYCSFSGNYNCPKGFCTKTFKSAGSLIGHLKSAHSGKIYTCPYCLRPFTSLTAITQHAESSSRRCRIRDTVGYPAYMDQLMAGLVDVDGGGGDDGGVTYRTSEKAKEMFGRMQQDEEMEKAPYVQVQQERAAFW